MRAPDSLFVALVAVGAGWALAGGALEVMAGGESRSLVWLALGRFFFLLSCTALCLALACGAWRMRHRMPRSRPFLAVTLSATAMPVISLTSGHPVPGWLLLTGGLVAMLLVQRPPRNRAA
jgi:hypothetical protein